MDNRRIQKNYKRELMNSLLEKLIEDKERLRLNLIEVIVPDSTLAYTLYCSDEQRHKNAARKLLVSEDKTVCFPPPDSRLSASFCFNAITWLPPRMIFHFSPSLVDAIVSFIEARRYRDTGILYKFLSQSLAAAELAGLLSDKVRGEFRLFSVTLGELALMFREETRLFFTDCFLAQSIQEAIRNEIRHEIQQRDGELSLEECLSLFGNALEDDVKRAKISPKVLKRSLSLDNRYNYPLLVDESTDTPEFRSDDETNNLILFGDCFAYLPALVQFHFLPPFVEKIKTCSDDDQFFSLFWSIPGVLGEVILAGKVSDNTLVAFMLLTSCIHREKKPPEDLALSIFSPPILIDGLWPDRIRADASADEAIKTT